MDIGLFFHKQKSFVINISYAFYIDSKQSNTYDNDNISHTSISTIKCKYNINRNMIVYIIDKIHQNVNLLQIVLLYLVKQKIEMKFN